MGAGDFVYRLSIAEVTQSCDFSAFPSYERIIVLLDGGGFTLQFADGNTHALDVPHVPFRFDGGTPVSCTVPSGPSRDLNLMVRRAAAQIDMAGAPADETICESAGPAQLFHAVVIPRPGQAAELTR
jgi:hypothetical protein